MGRRFRLCLLLSLLVAVSLATVVKKEAVVRYDNYKVYKIEVENEEQLDFLQKVQTEHKLDFWSEIRQYGETCDVLVQPNKQNYVETLLEQQNIKYTVKINNVQDVIDSQFRKVRAKGLEWTDYHTLDEIYDWLDLIISRYPNIVTPFSIGHSYEGREIRGIKISYKSGNEAVFIESNIHAREWITSASITYIIDEFLVSRNPNVRDIAENLDWYIIPVLNVDGFVYSHEVNRLWRKSRLPSDPNGECIGTDLNRNFDYLWMSAGASSDPCTETYAGPYAESDVEIKQLTQYIDNNIANNTIKIYISLHSYGQYVLSPWGHTEELPRHYPQMMVVAKGYADALNRRYDTVFTYGSSATTLYKVSGSGKEWAYGEKGIIISYTIELRDKGLYGFVLPPEQIIPTAKEVLDGFAGMVFAARDVQVLMT